MTTAHDHQAFPAFNTHGECLTSTDGLTKREYFAALAMQGLLASENANGFTESIEIAERAVSIADAAIIALNQSRNLAGLPED